MLMASDVAKYMVDTIKKYGDVPCVLEHPRTLKDVLDKREQDAILDPVNEVVELHIIKEGSDHKEVCLLFTSKQVVE